jgi:hypothetical protein
MIKEFIFENFGYLEDNIPTNLFNELKKEAFNIENNNVNKNEILLSGVTGEGTPKHYLLKNSEKNLNLYIKNLVDIYLNKFNYIKNFKLLKNSVPLSVDRPWLNIQKKHQFFPNHNHDGVLSYTLWLKIPYDIKKELIEGKHASTFEFGYTTVVGSLYHHRIKIDKSYEGKIIMFPALLQHCVYPFYTSDDNRISVSGNISFLT